MVKKINKNLLKYIKCNEKSKSKVYFMTEYECSGLKIPEDNKQEDISQDNEQENVLQDNE